MKTRGAMDLVRQAEEQGLRVKRTKKGYVIYGKTAGMVTVHLTCSDHRAIKNSVAALRKIGFQTTR